MAFSFSFFPFFGWLSLFCSRVTSSPPEIKRITCGRLLAPQQLLLLLLLLQRHLCDPEVVVVSVVINVGPLSCWCCYCKAVLVSLKKMLCFYSLVFLWFHKCRIRNNLHHVSPRTFLHESYFQIVAFGVVVFLNFKQ